MGSTVLELYKNIKRLLKSCYIYCGKIRLYTFWRKIRKWLKKNLREVSHT
jgi:hypothetical protein